MVTPGDDVLIAQPEMQAEYHAFGLTVLTKELKRKQSLDHAIKHILSEATYKVSCVHAAMLDPG